MHGGIETGSPPIFQDFIWPTILFIFNTCHGKPHRPRQNRHEFHLLFDKKREPGHRPRAVLHGTDGPHRKNHEKSTSSPLGLHVSSAGFRFNANPCAASRTAAPGYGDGGIRLRQKALLHCSIRTYTDPDLANIKRPGILPCGDEGVLFIRMTNGLPFWRAWNVLILSQGNGAVWDSAG